jgi:CBS domain-containing protein
MSRPAITIGEDEDIDAAAALMVRKRIARLPVVRAGKLVGIVARYFRWASAIRLTSDGIWLT